MSATGELVFVICGIFAIVTAVLTIVSRSPLRAAMALLGNILSLAGIYLTLHAHLLAAIQLLVYAGAVVVLFIFVIMLIGPSAMKRDEKDASGDKSVYVRTGAALLMAMLGAVIAFGISRIDRPYVDIDPCPDGAAECGQFGGVDGLGAAIYQQSAVPFELVSVLLLVAIIAAVAVARGHTPEEKRALEARRAPAPQTERENG